MAAGVRIGTGSFGSLEQLAPIMATGPTTAGTNRRFHIMTRSPSTVSSQSVFTARLWRWL